MKKRNLRIMSLMFALLGFATMATAQFDDIYFDPDDADEAYAAIDLEKYYDNDDVEAREIDDDYDYFYSSQIRRFDQPYRGFDFYSPVYVDPFYYDAAFGNFWVPGSSIYWGGAFPARTSFRRTFAATPAWGWGAPAAVTTWNTWGPFGPTTAVTTTWGGGFGNPAFGGGFVNPGFGGGFGGGFAGGGFAGGGFNAYCPPAVGGIFNNPSTGVFRPNNTVSSNIPGTRGTTVASGPVYGPRNSSGSVISSPRTNPRTNGTYAPDRPLPRSSAGNVTSPATSRPQSTVTRGSDARVSNAPRSDRPAYVPPTRNTTSVRNSAATRATTRTQSILNSRSNTSASRYTTSDRPSRPTSSAYRGSTGRNYRGTRPSSSSSRSTFSNTRSSSRSTFSSPRTSSRSSSSFRSSGSSTRSSGVSRSGGGSPRGGR